MKTHLAIAAFALALSRGAWADQPQMPPSQTPNTAAKAAETVTAFFPHSSSAKVLPFVSDTPFQASWDVTEPAAAVQRQYRLGMDGFQTGESAPYLALLASDYTQPGADRAKTT